MDRELSPSESRKIATTANAIRERTSHPVSVMTTFLDHVMAAGARWSPVRNIYLEWRTFEMETLPLIEGLLPVTEEEERGFEVFFADWKALSADLSHFRSVYDSPNRVGQMNLSKFYRNSPDFFRLLAVFRALERETERYPLFTMRAFLASQVEVLAGFLDRLVPGNVVSEKARERWEDWYCRKFYQPELVRRARKNPSENNPVANPAIRREYEVRRFQKGVRPGDLTFGEEEPITRFTRPALYEEPAPRVQLTAVSAVALPSHMRDLLDGDS